MSLANEKHFLLSCITADTILNIFVNVAVVFTILKKKAACHIVNNDMDSGYCFATVKKGFEA